MLTSLAIAPGTHKLHAAFWRVVLTRFSAILFVFGKMYPKPSQFICLDQKWPVFRASCFSENVPKTLAIGVFWTPFRGRAASAFCRQIRQAPLFSRRSHPRVHKSGQPQKWLFWGCFAALCVFGHAALSSPIVREVPPVDGLRAKGGY